MKKWLTTNLSLKLLSVLFAIGLWMIVVNVNDPVTTKTFRGISVTFVNENIISDAGKVYQVLDGSDSVSFTVRAKRSVIESLTPSDFKAVADFAERISETAVPIRVYPLKNEDKIQDVNLQKNTVKIALEEQISRTISVALRVVGTAAEGYTVGKADISPQEVTITGPQSLVDDIDAMEVVLDASNAKQDIESTVPGQLFDRNGDEISDGRLHCSASSFVVHARLLPTKSVDLDFSTEGSVKEGFRNTELHYTPTTVQIAGEQEALDKISTIVFPSSELNLEGADHDVVRTVDVTKYLPDDVYVVNDGDKKVTVTLKVVELNTQKVSFPVSRIDVLNTPTGLDVNFEGNLYMEIELQGLDADLQGLALDDLSVSVDVKNLGQGTHRVRTEVTTSNKNVELSEAPYVTVTLSSSREEPVASVAPSEGHADNTNSVQGE